MVKKKIKQPKSSKRRVDSLHEEDVQVNTGLPPQVEGQLRCFCRVSATQLTWNVPNTPDVTYARVKWWGESGDGVLFRPVDMKRGNSATAKTTARFPVRSGPKQFSSYLNDMSSLVLDVLSGAMQVPIGTVEVPHIGQLAPNRPVNGVYPIISPTDEKIGELHVSMMIESLMASYDSTGSIPTTDLSITSHVTQESTYPKQSQPVPHTQQPRIPQDDPFISPASHQNVETRLPNGYTEDLRQRLQYESDPVEKRYQPIQNGNTVAITTNGDVITTNSAGDVVKNNNDPIASTQPSQTRSSSDLLSVLLDRGNKLREQMIVSALDARTDNTAVKEPVAGPSYQPDRELTDMSMRSGDGSFLREILRAEKLYGPAQDNIEEATVDLVFGGQLTDDIRLLKNLHGSPNASISGDDDLMSDHEDPIHNESILNELFYKHQASSDDLSDLSCDETRVRRKHHESMDDESNMRPPSRSSSVCSLNLAFPDTQKKKPKSPKPSTPKRKSRLKLKRKGSKKRRSSKSRSRASGSEYSDSDAMSTASTPRSESSRVSFDMVPSDIEEPPTKDNYTKHKNKSKTVDGLSVERLTLLGRVHVARVTIDKLQLIGADLDTLASKPKSRTKYGMKPPKPSPKAKKQCTYFIEYQFPVVATSRDKYSPNAMATEVMRVVSRTVKNGVVSFNHRSVFPVMFDGTAVERWWKSALVFKVFSRVAGQKVPSLIGSCGIPLKSLLKAESLYIGRDIDVRQSDRASNTSLNGSKFGSDGLIGALKLVVELASDSKDFPTALAKTKLAELTGRAKIVPIAITPSAIQEAPKPPVPPQFTQRGEINQSAPRGLESRSRPTTPVSQIDPSSAEGLSIPIPVSVQHYHGDQTVKYYPSINQDVGETLTLHTVVLIPDGKGITMSGVPSLVSAKKHTVLPQPSAHTAPGVRARDLTVRNTYLVCRMFWCDESVHSAVCWGTTEPSFKFQQVAPVLMSQSLLERLKNNFMIIEVWDKKTSADNDKLVGIVKLSLHQFYMSFREKRICSALLKSQYPVIAVENYLPVVDPFSGTQYGQLNVLLAMGSAEQVAHLVRMKTEGVSAVSAPQRPQHYLERQDLLNQGDTIPAQIGTECVVEHIFEIVIEGVRGLNLFDNMIWGEADCFVQYHFPAQQQTNPAGAPVIRHAVPSMKAFRTATTLCIADPTFNDVTRHRLLLPQGTPVQRELLTACANTSGGAGGLPFELWCRYYHPNVRDQCIAKSSLPLAKLCAMITMQKRGEPSVQTFTFSLSHVTSDNGNHDDNEHKATNMSTDAGLMDVTVHYKTSVIQNEANIAAANKNLTGAQVCVSVGVIRACGLKTAAESAAHLDQGMQYPAEVGVNAYVRVKLSFLGAEGERITRTVARTFAPEFSHFMDFPCPLLWTEPDSDALCLAEILETAEATFEVWHQVPGLSSDLDSQLAGLTNEGVSGRKVVEKTGDVMLGTTTMSLVSLLSHRTGYTGWFPVNIPVTGWSTQSTDQEGRDTAGSDPRGGAGLSRVGGGLELTVKFAHHEDRERVIHAARGVGWSPVDLDIEQDDWESEDEDSNKYHHINITIDHVNFPLHNALIAGQNNLDKTAQCYVRYKFYDKAAVMTKFAGVTVNNNGYITSQPRNKHDLQIPDSSTFRWYLREERLEVQVWVSYGTRTEGQQRPKHRDKLIGSAYISMETLSDQRRKQHRISGMYPLFKPGSSSLGGGYIRAHIAARPQFGRLNQAELQEGIITIEGEDIDMDYDPDDSFHQIRSRSPQKAAGTLDQVEEGVSEGTEGQQDVATTFSVVIQVERAMHLPCMRDKQKSEDYFPNTYVSYPTAESSIQSYSSIFHKSNSPVWDHEHETKLSIEMLTQENKHLVFKVWHKPDGAPKSPDKLTDRVLGFVSVDLTPLANGMQQISGWYNVMDFNGQIKGQIKINVIPQDSVINSGQQNQAAGLLSEPYFLSLPAWQPTSMSSAASNLGPLSLPSYDQPHFHQHYDQVRQHHELLQHQLSDHIQQFLQQQEETQATTSSNGINSHNLPLSNHNPPGQGSEVTTVTQGYNNSISSVPGPSTSIYNREPSIHWRPSIPEYRNEDSSSRSYLFSNLRKNMQDLDEITNNLKSKLTVRTSPPSYYPHLTDSQRVPEFEIPTTSQSGQPLTSTQSTVLSFDLPRSNRETPRDDLGNTGSHGGESSRTAIDSGAFSVDNSNEKYDDSAPHSQRSCSDRLDTLRSSATPRELLGLIEDSGINNSNNSNIDELGLNMGLTLSPRESSEKKDEYSESGGFNYKGTPREGSYTPRDGSYTPRDVNPSPRGGMDRPVNSNANARTNVNIDTSEHVTKSDQKQMSMIQEFTENDDSDSGEDENKYYHRYRDLLNNEDDDNVDKYEEDSEDEGEIVVPRRINDVSGKFSPTGEIIMLSEDFENSVPYGVASLSSNRQTGVNSDPNSAPNTLTEADDMLQEVDSETEIEPRDNTSIHMTDQEQVVFDEKDSWLSDSDKENEGQENVTGYQYSHNSNGRAQKHKFRRQDSDTGYSSRDNVSESYHTPSAGGTNSETDISRLHEHEHWDQRDSDDHVAAKFKNRLLANVELESTGGSFGLRYDSGHQSRISSAGSRHTRKSSEPSITESYEKEEEGNGQLSERSEKNCGPTSARSEELSDFFKSEGQRNSTLERRKRFNSGSSDNSDEDYDDRNGNGETGSGTLQNGDLNSKESSPREVITTGENNKHTAVPNFFMPVQHLEESMKTLQRVTNKPSDPQQEFERAAAASEMVAKLTSKDKFGQANTKTRLPTADEAKRIAKIFSSKFS